MSSNHRLFDQRTFLPDFRDVILYNGYLPYRATGMFKADLIEFEQINEPSTIIYFNTKFTRQQYLDYHEMFGIIRNTDTTDFRDYSRKFSGSLYVPTGRWFYGKYATLWELMKVDHPLDVLYSRDIPFVRESDISGEKSLDVSIVIPDFVPE